jgi:gliding motility associated protien GldN
MKSIVQIFCLVSAFFLAGSTLMAQQPPQGGGTENAPKKGDIYKRKNIEERVPLPYHHLEEKDIVWEKRIWRVIDVHEMINNPFAYPPKPFITILTESANEGNIPIYGTDEFVDTIPMADLLSKLSRVDTIANIDEWGNPVEDDPLTEKREDITIIREEFNPENVTRYRIQEVWFFDEENSRMGVRIVGIAPLMEIRDRQSDKVLGESTMFWVYYPEARSILAREKAFNTASDVDVMSWEDIFEMRLFSSYIMKESNVYDRRISDYMKNPLDALFESENIHMGIFNLEQQSWQH